MEKRQSKWQRWKYPLILAAAFLVTAGLSVPRGYVYGSTTDWFSQHAALAETIRTACLEQKTLLPEYLELGGGSNGFLFSYYGYLRPDILLGCLFADVPMLYLVTAYMLAGYLASVILFYRLLREEEIPEFLAFWGSMLFLFAACFFQTHRQVMFINYMPFLLAALLMIRRKKYGWVCIFLSLVYCNSFYYAVSVLAAAGWYWYRQEGRSFLGNYIRTAAVSTGLTAALLIPTGLVILEHRRAGSGPEGIFAVRGDFTSLLYSPYGMGLTAVCLYALILGLGAKRLRADSVCYLLIAGFGLASYVLNGLLYARSKILIPFVPLVLLQCVRVFAQLQEGKLRRHFRPFVPLVLVAACYAGKDKFVWIAADLLVLAAVLPAIRGRKRSVPAYLILLILPACFFLETAKTEGYVRGGQAQEIALETKDDGGGSRWVTRVYAGDGRTGADTGKDTMEARNGLYRFDSIYEPLATGNRDASGERKKSTMYSSVTDADYREVYYDLLMTPVQINNRIALLAADNPFLLHFMGVRYLEAEPEHVPDGYRIVEKKGNRVIAENDSVLPVAYLVNDVMDETNFRGLEPYEKLDALMRTTVIRGEDGDAQGAEKTEGEAGENGFRTEMKVCEPVFRPCELPEGLTVQKTDTGAWEIMAQKKCTMTLELEEPFTEEILLLSFNVKSLDGKAVVIDINGIRNKLSGKGAPYPNGNRQFHYQFAEPDGTGRLEVTFSPGKYRIDGAEWHTWAKELFRQKEITRVSELPLSGHEIFACTAEAGEDGYFVTSIPLQRGMKILVDGKSVPVVTVNQAFAGAAVGAGRHTIKIAFTPPGLWAGYGISFLTVCVSAGYLCAAAPGKRRYIHRAVPDRISATDKASYFQRRHGNRLRTYESPRR